MFRLHKLVAAVSNSKLAPSRCVEALYRQTLVPSYLAVCHDQKQRLHMVIDTEMRMSIATSQVFWAFVVLNKPSSTLNIQIAQPHRIGAVMRGCVAITWEISSRANTFVLLRGAGAWTFVMRRRCHSILATQGAGILEHEHICGLQRR